MALMGRSENRSLAFLDICTIYVLDPPLFPVYLVATEAILKKRWYEISNMKYADDLYKLVHAWREQHGSTSEIDSIAKAVVFYAGGQCKPRPKISWQMWG